MTAETPAPQTPEPQSNATKIAVTVGVLVAAGALIFYIYRDHRTQLRVLEGGNAAADSGEGSSTSASTGSGVS